MVYILTDPNFAKSTWCRNLKNSLIEQLRKNRIDFRDDESIVTGCADAVFIIASDYFWIRSAVEALNAAELYPILICNHSEPISGCKYHCVSTDIYASVKIVLNKMHLKGDENLALYGVNTNSTSDIAKVDSLFYLRKDRFKGLRIYNNEGSLRHCFEEFSKDADLIDAVICTNDFAAISLVRHLNERPEISTKIKIYSLIDNELTKYFREHITSVKINYESFGKAALFLYKSLLKHSYISNITLNVAWDVSVGQAAVENSEISPEHKESDTTFYDDLEIYEMMTLDKLLNSVDTTDVKIIKQLLLGSNKETIADECFMTESAVRYRIKRLLAVCNMVSTRELLNLLTNYIPNFGMI